MEPPPPRVPPMSRQNYRWWARTYGHRSANAGSAGAAAATPELVGTPAVDEKALFDAIRANNVAAVERQLESCPAIAITKTATKQTALYVASFFARHEIVRLLLARGADRDLACGGSRPIDVVGLGRSDPVGRMKVRALLSDDAAISVLIQPASRQQPLRALVHFSAPVAGFTADDICALGCRVARFSRLRADLFAVDVELCGTAPSQAPSVQVPAGVVAAAAPSAEPAPRSQCRNGPSNPFHFRPPPASRRDTP